jgi:hypothetical protein
MGLNLVMGERALDEMNLVVILDNLFADADPANSRRARSWARRSSATIAARKWNATLTKVGSRIDLATPVALQPGCSYPSCPADA